MKMTAKIGIYGLDKRTVRGSLEMSNKVYGMDELSKLVEIRLVQSPIVAQK